MTVFVALLAMQSFITVPSDNVGIKAARFTVSNGVPFIGGAVSDSLSVMYGGIGIIRNNFGVFGIITGGVLILPSIISVLCYKLAFSLAASFSDLFGISQLTGLMKCAEGVSSIITAMLVSFLLMAVISISLMILWQEVRYDGNQAGGSLYMHTRCGYRASENAHTIRKI